MQYPPDQEELNAVARISDAIKGAKLLNTSGNEEHTLNDPKVSIGVEIAPFEEHKHENFVIKIDEPSITHHPRFAEETLRKLLAQIPELAEKTQFESDIDHAAALKATMQDLIAKGADIPANYLEWRGFQQIDGTPVQIQNYAMQEVANPPEYGFHAYIQVPMNGEEGKDPKTALDAVVANIKSRVPDVKKMLAERIIKYKKADEAAAANIRTQVEALQFDIVGSENITVQDKPSGSVSINISSPEQVKQAEASATATTISPLDNDKTKALENSNPLNLLTKEERGKAMGRSFLYAGEKAQDIFPIIAGREDMRIGIVKSLHRLEKAKPELAAEISQVLNDDMFKKHDDYFDNKPGDLKHMPVFTKAIGEPLKIEIPMDAGVPDKLITELSNAQIAKNAGQVAQEAAGVAQDVVNPQIPLGNVPQQPNYAPVLRILNQVISAYDRAAG